MAEPTSALAKVPGATIYYKIRGTGPLLLMLQGGNGDADGTDALAEHLMGRYTVLSYDRRGLSRSRPDRSSCRPIITGTASSTGAPRPRARDARGLIKFLVEEFGFEEVVVYGQGDRVDHAQLSWPLGGGVMLGSARPDDEDRWPLRPGSFGA